MNPFNLYEAYAAVYDEDLREELEVIDEDLSFIDDLSDNELTQIMEEIIHDGEVSLNECYYAFDEEVLTEARVDMSARAAARREYAAASEKSAKEARKRGAAKERSERMAARVERVKAATGRAAERIRAGAESAKTKGAGAISAMAGGAAEAGRKGKAAAHRVGGKLAAAKERISGFVKRVGRAAGAGYKAAKAEFSGEAGREAQERIAVRRQERESQRASRRAASSPFTGRNTTRRGGGVGRREAASSGGISSRGGEMGRGPSSTGRALTGAPERKALPAATSAPESARRKAAKAKIAKAVSGSVAQGTRFAAPGGQLASQRAKTGKQEALGRFRKKAGIAEEYLDMILDNILEEIIHEGYAADYEGALYVFEEIGMDDLGELAESYLVEQVETDDYYDVVLEHLLDEGYAETVEDATTIMANMSEEWRDEIIDEALEIMSVTSPEGKVRKGKRVYSGRASLMGQNARKLEALQRRQKTNPRAQGTRSARRQAAQEVEDNAKKSIKRLNVDPNSEVKHGYEDDNTSIDREGYREVPTDYRARKRRASGR